MRFHLAVLFLFCCTARYAGAQTSPQDSLFTVARTLAQGGAYDKALDILSELRKSDPGNHDYTLFSARVWLWKKNYRKARTLAASVPRSQTEALDILSAAALWSGNSSSALALTSEALQLPGTDSVLFLFRKAQALEQLRFHEEAKDAYATVMRLDPTHAGASRAHEALRIKLLRNKVSAGYLLTAFDRTPEPLRHLAFAEYQRMIKRSPLLFRVNYGDVFARQSFQVEADAYPRLGRNTYLYLNTGYSPGDMVFPRFRAGAEIYQKAGGRLELSAGARYLRFDRDVMLYTASAGLYAGHFWMNYRTFAVQAGKQAYFTHTIIVRRYLRDEEGFIGLNAFFGASPFYFSLLNDFTRTHATGIGIELRLHAGKQWYVRPALLYENEEYVPGQYRNRINGQLILSKSF